MPYGIEFYILLICYFQQLIKNNCHLSTIYTLIFLHHKIRINWPAFCLYRTSFNKKAKQEVNRKTTAASSVSLHHILRARAHTHTQVRSSHNHSSWQLYSSDRAVCIHSSAADYSLFCNYHSACLAHSAAMDTSIIVEAGFFFIRTMELWLSQSKQRYSHTNEGP